MVLVKSFLTGSCMIIPNLYAGIQMKGIRMLQLYEINDTYLFRFYFLKNIFYKACFT